MKTKTLATMLIAIGASGLAVGEGVATPTTPAPAVAPAPLPAANRVIYAPRLPGAAELTNVGKAQGLSVERIDQTATQVTVVYQNANGQANTVAYELLPTATTAPVRTVVPTSPPPAVVYEPAPRVYYYDSYPPDYYYRPDYWYPPVSLSFGFGFRGGNYHGGYGYGFHHRGR